MIAVDIPIKTVSAMNVREHWAKRAARAKRHRQSARDAMHSIPIPWMPVTITMIRRSAGTLDDDNLRGALKATRDGIADAYSVADNDPRITWCYGQEKCPRGKYGVRVEVTQRPLSETNACF